MLDTYPGIDKYDIVYRKECEEISWLFVKDDYDMTEKMSGKSGKKNESFQ